MHLSCGLTNDCLLLLCLHSADDSGHFLVNIHLKCKVIIRGCILWIVYKEQSIVVAIIT